MKRTKIALVLAASLLSGGCCCGQPEAGLRKIRAAVDSIPKTERQFVVLRATPLAAAEDGKRQLLIESSVVAVRRAGPIEALDSAERLPVSEAPAWLAGTQLPDVTFGAQSEVVARPSVVTQETDEATIQTAQVSGNGVDRNLSEISVTPEYDASGGVTLTFRYDHHDHGRRMFSVPPVALAGPAGRVFIVEALPPR